MVKNYESKDSGSNRTWLSETAKYWEIRIPASNLEIQTTKLKTVQDALINVRLDDLIDLDLNKKVGGMALAYKALIVEGSHKLETYKKTMVIFTDNNCILVSKLELKELMKW